MSLHVKLDAYRARRRVESIGHRLLDSAGLRRVMGERLAEFHENIFATRGFGEWAPLRPSTIKAKGSARPLVDTGRLLNDLTDAGRVRMRGDTIVLDTDHPGAKPLAAGDRDRMAPRNPSPEPPRETVRDWAARLLDFALEQ